VVEFVGFAQSPQVPEGATLLTNKTSVHTSVSYKDAAATLLTKSAASAWLASVQKWNLDLGSKLTFTDGDLVDIVATVTEANLPKSFAIIANEFGQLRIVATKNGAGTLLEIDFARWSLPEDQERFLEISNAVIGRAQKLLEVNRVG
jgi:hypothetical protein